jgi:hypothetical protein
MDVRDVPLSRCMWMHTACSRQRAIEPVVAHGVVRRLLPPPAVRRRFAHEGSRSSTAEVRLQFLEEICKKNFRIMGMPLIELNQGKIKHGQKKEISLICKCSARRRRRLVDVWPRLDEVIYSLRAAAVLHAPSIRMPLYCSVQTEKAFR